MKILQINTTVNSGSTGRIAEEIGKVAMENGHESYIAYGRGNRPSTSQLIKIGGQKDVLLHGVKTALFDRHGFGSKRATAELVKKIDEIKPDVIGLHNLHGYYLHIGELFQYLNTENIPILWTLFDCWAFTGHCSYFDDIDCPKWKTHCEQCPKTRKYPKSYWMDNAYKNFSDKKHLFNLPDHLELVVHSKWLEGLVKQSFLGNKNSHHIFSGIDLNTFKPTDSNLRNDYRLQDKQVLLGVANIWDERKGLADFMQLSETLEDKYQIVLIGLSQNQLKSIPHKIIGISRTESVEKLAQWYSLADLFINPTYLDNFPTTNIEALACGTPVITYKTGGSPEAIDDQTGKVADKGNIQEIVQAIKALTQKDTRAMQNACRQRAESHFNKNDRYRDYLSLYEAIVEKYKTNNFS